MKFLGTVTLEKVPGNTIHHCIYNSLCNWRYRLLIEKIVKMSINFVFTKILPYSTLGRKNDYFHRENSFINQNCPIVPLHLPTSWFWLFCTQQWTTSDRAIALPPPCSTHCIYLNSNMHSSCISKQVQRSGGCQTRSRQEVHVYLTDGGMLLIEDDKPRQ